MFPQNVLPPALRSAPVEEQLSYLLQRRRTIERLLQSLETYVRAKESPPREAQGSVGNSQAA